MAGNGEALRIDGAELILNVQHSIEGEDSTIWYLTNDLIYNRQSPMHRDI